MHIKILLVICFIYINSVAGQVGNACNLPVTGKKGVCKLASNCPSAKRQSDVGIRPVFCGRQNNAPIVCCEGSPTVSVTVAPVAPHYPNPKPINFNPNQGLRKSEQKCKEYTKTVTSIVESAPLSAISGSVRYEVSNCTYDGIPLIFGGKEAVLGEFPHMALLGFIKDKVYWLCGGSLISEQFVLTAAHCLSSKDWGDVKIVRLGELKISTQEPNSHPEDLNVIQTFPHPDFHRPKVYNDIALIKFSRRVQFSSYIRPACLWNKIDLGTTTTIATGWGTTEKDLFSTSDSLLKVGLDIVSNSECHNMYKDYFDRKVQSIQRNMICARNTTHQGDTCTGDSGGPIQVTKSDNTCIFYVIGITAAGKACGGSLPGLYTRVSEYIDWIETIVWP